LWQGQVAEQRMEKSEDLKPYRHGNRYVDICKKSWINYRRMKISEFIEDKFLILKAGCSAFQCKL